MTGRHHLDRYRTLRLVGALACLSAVLGACTLTGEEVTASLPNDYRQRHPIAVTEADRSIVVFVGHADKAQRAIAIEMVSARHRPVPRRIASQ
jgi:pilus assembly protein CpaD